MHPGDLQAWKPECLAVIMNVYLVIYILSLVSQIWHKLISPTNILVVKSLDQMNQSLRISKNADYRLVVDSSLKREDYPSEYVCYAIFEIKKVITE